MDDCNRNDGIKAIALEASSDSSMDDCNADVGGGLADFAGSDSSMDDCNGKAVTTKGLPDKVQIPLWTIVTTYYENRESVAGRFRFLYGRL